MNHFGYLPPINEFGFIESLGCLYITYFFICLFVFELIGQSMLGFPFFRFVSPGTSLESRAYGIQNEGFLFPSLLKLKFSDCPMTKQIDSDLMSIYNTSISEPTNSHEKREVYSFNPSAGIP